LVGFWTYKLVVILVVEAQLGALFGGGGGGNNNNNDE
jgi:hypothetical protein